MQLMFVVVVSDPGENTVFRGDIRLKDLHTQTLIMLYFCIKAAKTHAYTPIASTIKTKEIENKIDCECTIWPIRYENPSRGKIFPSTLYTIRQK